MSPWALGLGALVSFTAVAGQDSATGWNAPPLASRATPANATPASAAREAAAPVGFADAATGDFGGVSHGLIQQARLAVGAPDDFRTIPDEREPHVELKPEVKAFPEVDRTHKGDPIIAMRPSMETRAKPPRALELIKPATDATEARLDAGKQPGPQPAAASTEEATPRKSAASPTQAAASATTPGAEQSARTAASAETRQEAANAALLERAAQGATPAISRAVALGSSTPAQPDATPIEVSSFTGPTLALGKAEKGRPDYASLVDHGKLDREKRCLAEAVYFESRSEPESGQAAVAQVVLNRVSSGLYPSSICGVVYQNRHHWHACQFSFACEGRSLRITERESWERAVRVANEVMDGRTYISDVGQSTHYHANYVRPRWARALTKMDVIGRHIFYRLKPGQT